MTVRAEINKPAQAAFEVLSAGVCFLENDLRGDLHDARGTGAAERSEPEPSAGTADLGRKITQFAGRVELCAGVD
jgi:hypothetical protein